ncbi:MAG: BatD family protein [Candidatus Zixiibacteriota bacterium]
MNLQILRVSLAIIMILFVSEAFAADTTTSKIELKSWADKLELGSDQNLIFSVQAVWMGELDRFNIQPIRPPECQNLEILGSSSVNETKIIEGKSKTFKTFSFILKPTQQGQGEIGNVEFGYVDPLTQDTSWLSTQPLVVQIGPPVKKGSGDGVIYLVLILLIFFTTLTYFVIRKREKETKEEQTKTEEKTEKTLEQKVSEKLHSLEPILNSERTEEFFSEVYKLLTGYLEKRYHIMTSGKTTPEIMKSLSGFSIEEKQLKRVESILKRCDLVKFARETVKIEEGEKVMENFKRILEQSE